MTSPATPLGGGRGQVATSPAGSGDVAAFGAFALPPRMESLRRYGQTLGRGAWARRACSLIRRVVTAGRKGPYDVEVFPGQNARLYPGENLSDKRVFGGVQFWDWAERAALGVHVRASDEPVYFVDAGANAGLYTLAVRSEARGKALKALAIEPDPENVTRLKFNLAASGADDVVVAEVALGAEEGSAHLATSNTNRGELALADKGTRVALRPLHAVVGWAGFPRVDALKIDIEGMEEDVLAPYFKDAPRALWPGMVILEARRGEITPALDLLLAHGYAVAERSRMNVVLCLGADQEETQRSTHGKT
ncbi:MAG: FkbM family methyltransferase [Paracoccaceae bacterium]